MVVFSIINWPLHPLGKIPWCPLVRRMGGPEIQSRPVDREKNLSPNKKKKYKPLS
jgi:hypothetical protein